MNKNLIQCYYLLEKFEKKPKHVSKERLAEAVGIMLKHALKGRAMYLTCVNDQCEHNAGYNGKLIVKKTLCVRFPTRRTMTKCGARIEKWAVFKKW